MLKRTHLFFLFIFIFAATTTIANAETFQFTRNLYPGLRSDPDVIKMQDLLRVLGFFKFPTSTGNYLGITTESVKEFQIASNIKPANGYFGPLTRGQANRLTSILDNLVTPKGSPPPVDPLSYSFSTQKTATSTYYGKLKIYNVGGYSRVDPINEFITIRNQSTTTEPISITGFRLVTTSKEEFIIPKGQNFLDITPRGEVDITLSRYDYARIVSGRQNNQVNFKDNICAGYFNEFSDFNGEIPDSCPKPNVRDASPKLPDHCIRIFEGAGSCRTIDKTTIQVPECVAFADAHFNYQGCVRDNIGRDDFYGRNWHIWMQRNKKFLRTIHDTITLYDPGGKVVDVYSY